MYYEHSRDIITNYKNIVVEKPIFMRPSQVKEIYKIAKNGVKIFPIFQNRYNLAVKRTKEQLENEIGKLIL